MLDIRGCKAYIGVLDRGSGLCRLHWFNVGFIRS